MTASVSGLRSASAVSEINLKWKLLPYKPGQMRNSYPLLREFAGTIPTGIAVQEGNYEHTNPKTGQQVTIPDLVGFATEYLHVDYIFWCTQEPFYSRKLIPFLEQRP
jgi:hypothetical protein